jgi:hypothetical protein
MCSHTKAPQWVLIKGLQPLFQEQEVTLPENQRNSMELPTKLFCR